MTFVYKSWDLKKKKSQDLGGNQTYNLHNSSVMIYQLSYQALGRRVVGSKVFVHKHDSWCWYGYASRLSRDDMT